MVYVPTTTLANFNAWQTCVGPLPKDGTGRSFYNKYKDVYSGAEYAKKAREAQKIVNAYSANRKACTAKWS